MILSDRGAPPSSDHPVLRRPMNGVIRLLLRNPIAVTVMTPAVVLLGVLATLAKPVDIHESR
jgi:hypothetical protein